MIRSIATTEPILALTIANGASVTSWFDVSKFRAGSILFPASMDGDEFHLEAATDINGSNSGPVNTGSGVDSTTLVYPGWIALPDITGLAFVRIKTIATGGAAENQSAARSLYVTLKS